MSVVQHDVKLNYLPTCEERLLGISREVASRKKIITMYEKVAIETGSIEEAPALCESTNISTTSGANSLISCPAYLWFHKSAYALANLAHLHRELDCLRSSKWVMTKLRHNLI
jgi:hypothetical protein